MEFKETCYKVRNEFAQYVYIFVFFFKEQKFYHHTFLFMQRTNFAFWRPSQNFCEFLYFHFLFARYFWRGLSRLLLGVSLENSGKSWHSGDFSFQWAGQTKLWLRKPIERRWEILSRVGEKTPNTAQYDMFCISINK